MARRSVVALLASAAVVPLAVPATAYQRPGYYTQVDVSNDGKAANGSSGEMSMSANGRVVAFSSTASNLGGGSVPQLNVYARDLARHRTILVSRGADGQQAVPSTAGRCVGFGGGGAASSVGSNNPAISATGRYVAFASSDVNLIHGGVTNATDNVYVYDLARDQMRLASVSSTGTLANGWSCSPSISADGQRVTFISAATNLVPNQAPGLGVFVHDFGTGKTSRVDVSSAGVQATKTCMDGAAAPDVVQSLLAVCTERRPAGSISADGRYVVFDTAAGNLVAGDTNNQTDVFERDLKTGTTTRVSVATGGGQAMTPATAQDALVPEDIGSYLTNVWCTWERHHDVSDDGRYVLFLSRASNLVPGDTNAHPVGAGFGIDVFVHDNRTNRTYRVDVTSAGVQNGASGGLGYYTIGCDISMSGNGRYVAVNGPPSGYNVYDLATGTNSAFPSNIGTNAAGTAGYAGSAVLDVSADGRYAGAVMTNMSNNAASYDLFVWDRGSALGVGGFGDATSLGTPPPSCNGIAVGSLCLPPGSVLASAAHLSTGSTPAAGCGAGLDAGLRSASIAYRPKLGDLYVRLSLAPGAIDRARHTATVLGLDFAVHGRSYDVRADGNTIGLYDGSGALAGRVATLQGGFGSTGEEVVFALPLAAVGLAAHEHMTAVSAYAGLGTALTGNTCAVNRIGVG